jgi:hypothetical protein
VLLLQRLHSDGATVELTAEVFSVVIQACAEVQPARTETAKELLALLKAGGAAATSSSDVGEASAVGESVGESTDATGATAATSVDGNAELLPKARTSDSGSGNANKAAGSSTTTHAPTGAAPAAPTASTPLAASAPAPALAASEKLGGSTYSSLVVMFAGEPASSRDVPEIVRLLAAMVEGGSIPTTAVCCTVATTLATAVPAQIDGAIRVLETMVGEGLVPTIGCFNAVITGCSTSTPSPRVDDILGILGAMQRLDVRPDRTSYAALLSSCANAYGTLSHLNRRPMLRSKCVVCRIRCRRPVRSTEVVLGVL